MSKEDPRIHRGKKRYEKPLDNAGLVIALGKAWKGRNLR